ncbi:MAG: Abi family protein [Lachnospiraceae bacterium]|nr:Abi family protein [Lachnospiraceae bacterium]
MSDKPFITYEQQVEVLKAKGLEVPDERHIMMLLKEYSYFALVSGYKGLLKNRDGSYKPHTTIDDIYALYEFDNDLRALVLRYVFIIENHIKSLMSYAFCKEHGDSQQAYLDVTKYTYNSLTQNGVNELVNRLSRIIDESDLTRMIDMLSRFRNVCAHNERLYDYRYRKRHISDMDVHSILGIPKAKGVYKKGKNDLFAVVVIFKYLLRPEDFEPFVDSLEKLFATLFSKTRRIQEEQLLKKMGFPHNWKAIRNCEKKLGKASA